MAIFGIVLDGFSSKPTAQPTTHAVAEVKVALSAENGQTGGACWGTTEFIRRFRTAQSAKDPVNFDLSSNLSTRPLGAGFRATYHSAVYHLD